MSFKSFNSETKTRISEAAIIGAAIGFLSGGVFCWALQTGHLSISGINSGPNIGISILILFVAVLFGAFAGALVGEGIPKAKQEPDQGIIKKFKEIKVGNKSAVKTVLIPIEKRQDRRNNDIPTQNI